MKSTRRTFRVGLVVGLIAYVAVAFLYSAFDLMASRHALFTADLLGKAVYNAVRDPDLLFEGGIDPAAVFWYNAAHLVVALAIGVGVTKLAAYTERHPSRTPLALLALVVAAIAVVLAVNSVTDDLPNAVPWLSIATANALAAALAGVYLLTRRPEVWPSLMRVTPTAQR